jgi:SAM-dependent methyltransferase
VRIHPSITALHHVGLRIAKNGSGFDNFISCNRVSNHFSAEVKSKRRCTLSRFGPDPLDFFSSVYRGIPPWDIGAPQPAMLALLAKYPPAAPILDVGCGSGDLAIYLAQLGHKVVGIDFVESAIADARKKAASLTPETAQLLSFQAADALKPTHLGQKFRAVVDSGFYHLFDPEQCDELVDEIAAALLPGGHYYLHEFAVEFPVPNLPRQITADELRGRFSPERGWRIREVQATEFLSRVAPPVPAVCACIERLPT